MSEYLPTSIVCDVCGGVAPATLRRLIVDEKFPKPKTIGRSNYYLAVGVYRWISAIADRPVTQGNRLLSSKTLETIFKRSPAWVWKKFQKDKNRKSKAIYIRSRPHWLESEVYSDPELKKYLAVIDEVA